MASASDEDRAGDLLIQEVDEDLRRDQYLKLWKRYGKYAVAGAVLIIVGVAGWQGWQSWQRQQRFEQAERFAAALALADAGKTKEADQALAKMASDGKGFAALAGMRRAELLAAGGDKKGAIEAYQRMADSSLPELLRGLATVKEALLALDEPNEVPGLAARLDALAGPGGAWRYQAIELQALFAHRKGDDKRATALFKQLADDAQAPAGVRSRSAEMLAVLAPSPAASAPPGAAAPTQAPPAPAPAVPAPAPAAQDKK